MEYAAPLRVLIVEDDGDDFILVDELLRREMEVRTQQAVTVEEALERMGESSYDLLLLDYSLGARTGFDLLEELRRRDVGTPVIFLTGHGGEEIAVRALKAGAVDYISKARLSAATLGPAVRYALALGEKDAAVREARQALAARERDYRMLFENANDAIVIIDPETECILEANPAACLMYEGEREQLIGASLLQFSTEAARGRIAIDECLRVGSISNFETVHRTQAGRQVHLLANASLVEYHGRPAMMCGFRDISDRKAAEREIFRLNRALKALSKCSEALLHAHDQQQFLDEICSVVVQFGGYRMAWVAGAPRGEGEGIRAIAQYGTSKDYPAEVCRRSREETGNDSLLVPTALRTGEPAVCRDTITDPRAASLREECEQLGLRSILALPLRVEERVAGVLAIYAAERDAFDAAEVELLRELAGNVSYGLESLDARHQKEVAQNELRASEERLRNLIETANEGIWTIDAEERTTFVNAKMAALIGCSPEEMIGRSVFDFVDPAQQKGLRQAIEQRREAARGHYEVALIRADGAPIVTSLNSSPILDGKGEYAGALAMISDITEQKKAEEKLRASEQRYRTLFERNLAGVFRATAEGELLEANESFVRMLGYEAISEVVAKKLPALCAAAGFAEHWCAELATAGHLVNYELRILRRDGSTACLLANLVYLHNANGPDQMEGTVLDITERRHLEAQLLQSQKMEAIGQLAGGIAHDFNNLLMVIRSYAELAGETVQDNSISKELEAILKAADRGAVLTRQLLTFGRKQIFTPRMVCINSVLENITKVLPRALGEEIRVETVTAADLWQVKADPVQIEQLILNLAVNARDAMPGGGRLTLETANVVLDSDYVKMHAGVVPGEYVQLAVSDSGNGIPPDILPRIFEPFFTTKARGKGTGLGLPTVYGIVQQSGGFIWVYSEPNHGTVFKVYLPRAGAAVAADAGQSTKEIPSRGWETILLVEDEEAVRSAARTYLSLQGYNVLEADCGEAALRLSQAMPERKIDLLITDAVMPGMNGGALGRAMLQERPEIRVIYVSGYTEATIGGRGAGATFLQKPFSLSALARKVREVLDAPAAVEHQCVA